MIFAFVSGGMWRSEEFENNVKLQEMLNSTVIALEWSMVTQIHSFLQKLGLGLPPSL